MSSRVDSSESDARETTTQNIFPLFSSQQTEQGSPLVPALWNWVKGQMNSELFVFNVYHLKRNTEGCVMCAAKKADTTF